MSIRHLIQVPIFIEASPTSQKMLLIFTITVCAAVVGAIPQYSKRQAFDPTAQHIDVSNAHAFIAPGASDLRGPCPALNALANHGYIARNGYTNFLESLNASTEVYGMAMNPSKCPQVKESNVDKT